MKTKLTITIDEDLLPEFKDYAASVGESLSQVIEDSVKEKLKKKKPSFADKWRGCLKGKFWRKGQDPRMDYLIKRYDLPTRARKQK